MDAVTGPGPAALVVDTVLAALDSAARAASGVQLVGIDGRSGSGKTGLAGAVAAARGCPVVRLEQAYAGWDGLAATIGAVCTELLLPLARGEAGGYRRYDWAAGALAEWVSVEPAELMVVEGVGALSVPCREVYQLRVWLEAPTAVRKAQALARDGATFAPHWDRWAAQEDLLFADGAAASSAHLRLTTTP